MCMYVPTKIFCSESAETYNIFPISLNGIPPFSSESELKNQVQRRHKGRHNVYEIFSKISHMQPKIMKFGENYFCSEKIKWSKFQNFSHTLLRVTTV